MGEINNEIYRQLVSCISERESFRVLAEQGNVHLGVAVQKIKEHEALRQVMIRDYSQLADDSIAKNNRQIKELRQLNDEKQALAIELDNEKKDKLRLIARIEDVEERLEACLLMNPVPSFKDTYI